MAYWLRGGFIHGNQCKFLNGNLDWLTERQGLRGKGERESSEKPGQGWHTFFSFSDVQSCMRSAQNVHGCVVSIEDNISVSIG